MDQFWWWDGPVSLGTLLDRCLAFAGSVILHGGVAARSAPISIRLSVRATRRIVLLCTYFRPRYFTRHLSFRYAQKE